MLVEADFPPARLEVEITETCLHDYIGVVRSLITSIKHQDIRVSLDDFGAVYSGLAQLRTLPFDRIKIDPSFISKQGRQRGQRLDCRGDLLAGARHGTADNRRRHRVPRGARCLAPVRHVQRSGLAL